MAGEEQPQIATIVKVTQNALLGVVAVALTVYFALKVEHREPTTPIGAQLWQRFPKFVLGFLATSIIATGYLGAVDAATGRVATGRGVRRRDSG